MPLHFPSNFQVAVTEHVPFGLFPVGVRFFSQAEDGIRDGTVTGVQTCALPILRTGEPYVRKRGGRSDAAGFRGGAEEGDAQFGLVRTRGREGVRDGDFARGEEERAGGDRAAANESGGEGFHVQRGDAAAGGKLWRGDGGRARGGGIRRAAGESASGFAGNEKQP